MERAAGRSESEVWELVVVVEGYGERVESFVGGLLARGVLVATQDDGGRWVVRGRDLTTADGVEQCRDGELRRAVDAARRDRNESLDRLTGAVNRELAAVEASRPVRPREVFGHEVYASWRELSTTGSPRLHNISDYADAIAMRIVSPVARVGLRGGARRSGLDRGVGRAAAPSQPGPGQASSTVDGSLRPGNGSRLAVVGVGPVAEAVPSGRVDVEGGGWCLFYATIVAEPELVEYLLGRPELVAAVRAGRAAFRDQPSAFVDENVYAAAQALRAGVVTFVQGMALGGAEMVYLRTVVPGIERMLDVDVRSALVAFVRDPLRWQDPMFGDHMPLLLAWTLQRRLTIGEAGGLPRGVGEFDGPAIPLYRMHESHEFAGVGWVDVEHYRALVDPVWTYTGPPIAVDRVAEVVAEHRLPAMVVPAGLLAAGADDARAVPSNNVGGLAGPGPADRFTVFADAQAADVGLSATPAAVADVPASGASRQSAPVPARPVRCVTRRHRARPRAAARAAEATRGAVGGFPQCRLPQRGQ